MPERAPRWLRIVVAVTVAAVVGWLLLNDGGDEPVGSASPTSIVVSSPVTVGDGDGGRGATIAVSGLPAGYTDELPPEVLDVLDLIESGGPYPYRQDGSTFFNREGRLPLEEERYYREFTVETPGSLDRGARRLVVGERGEVFYTDDHYDSFVEVVDVRV